MDLGRDKTVARIISRLEAVKTGGGAVKVEGTWGSFARLLTAYISEKLARPILCICPHIEDADKAIDDLQTFGCKNVEALAAWEGEEELADATDETRAERLKLVARISSLVSGGNGGRLVIPAPVQALCQPVPKPQLLQESSLRLEISKPPSPEEVVKWLVQQVREGYLSEEFSVFCVSNGTSPPSPCCGDKRGSESTGLFTNLIQSAAAGVIRPPGVTSGVLGVHCGLSSG